MKPLAGKVALVAGAARGAGRGVARMLGEAGATVYCTGRSSKTQPNTSTHPYAGRPETIEETAELVTAGGGTGIPLRVDHAIEGEVAALFAQVKREQKRLDVLVNLLTGPPIRSWGQPFWKQSLDQGRAMIEGWIWPHLITCYYATPLMVERRAGLVVEILEHHTIGYHANLFYDLAIVSLKRLMYDMAEELGKHKVAALTVAPGFMRTEAILQGFGVTEANWKSAVNNPQAKQFGFAGSESPCFVGRAVAALAADARVMRKSGGIFSSWDLADEYGFSDVDGAQPRWGSYFQENFAGMFGKSPLKVTWEIRTEKTEKAEKAGKAGKAGKAAAT